MWREQIFKLKSKVRFAPSKLVRAHNKFTGDALRPIGSIGTQNIRKSLKFAPAIKQDQMTDEQKERIKEHKKKRQNYLKRKRRAEKKNKPIPKPSKGESKTAKQAFYFDNKTRQVVPVWPRAIASRPGEPPYLRSKNKFLKNKTGWAQLPWRTYRIGNRSYKLFQGIIVGVEKVATKSEPKTPKLLEKGGTTAGTKAMPKPGRRSPHPFVGPAVQKAMANSTKYKQAFG